MANSESIPLEKVLHETEAKMHGMFEDMPVPIFRSTFEGKFLFVNSAMASMFGYDSPEDMITIVNKTSIAEATYEDPALRSFFVEEVRQSAANWKSFENRYRRKDGTIFDALLHVGVRTDAKTGQQLLYGFLQDITERKHLEKIQKKIDVLMQPMDDVASLEFADLFDIRKMQEIQDSFAQAAGVASIITHPDGTPITRGSNFCRLCNAIIRKTKKGLANCIYSDSVIGRQNPEGPIVQPCLSGGLWDAGASITVGGKHIANWLIGQVRNQDLDEARMLEYAKVIGANEDEFREALNEVPIMSKEQFESISKALFLISKELSDKAYQNIQQARYIEERNRAAELLRVSEQQYRLLFQSMTGGFALHEIIRAEDGTVRDYRFLELNAAFEEITGLKAQSLIGHTVLEVMPKIEPRWIETYGKVALTGKAVHFERYNEELGKFYEVVAYSPEHGRFATIFHDITDIKLAEKERADMERRLQQAQKLESLGVLAGGIAHDFNNLLMVVLGHADVALEELPPTSPVREDIEQIEQAAHKAADLCRQMLMYSGKGGFLLQNIDLSAVVEEIIHLLKASISKKATLNLTLEKGLPHIKGDASQIRQIVMNLVINASEALMDQNGVITVNTGVKECDEECLRGTYLQDNLLPGTYVYLDVSDTGTGMDEETKQRVFEPFYTTKFTGRGLGMSAVLGILRAHKGAIRVATELGRGTTFKVLFPALPDNETYASTLPATRRDQYHGAGTLLLVDDEESVRTIGKKMLTQLGFNVLVASDGQEALDIFREHLGKIAVVLLDMTMPKMDGAEAFQALRQMDPSVRVVLCSGYSEQDLSERFAGKGLSGFMQKPYSINRLGNLLRDLLE